MTANRSAKRATKKLAADTGIGHRAAAHQRGVGTATSDVTPLSAETVDSILADLHAIPGQHDAADALITVVTRHRMLAERHRRSAPTTPVPDVAVLIPQDRGHQLADAFLTLARRLYIATGICDPDTEWHEDVRNDTPDLQLWLAVSDADPSTSFVADITVIPLAATITTPNIAAYLKWLYARRGTLISDETAATVADLRPPAAYPHPVETADLERCALRAEAIRDDRLATTHTLTAIDTLSDDDLGRVTTTDITAAAYETIADIETPSVQNYLQSLGVDGPIEDHNLEQVWAANEYDPHTTIAVGSVLNDAGNKTPELAEVDIAESAKGGTGPSGAASGMTGSGKSFLLRGYVLSAAMRYSPTRLNFILMDFKGGATFTGMDRLPHVQAVITNLESDVALLGRAEAVIRGEILRREELISKHAKAADIDEYRKLRRNHPELDLPALPNLVIVADEFREFIINNREHLKLFESVAQKGRALGIHLLLVSQLIDEYILGSIQQNLTYGISLRVTAAAYSKTVIHSPSAAELPLGNGDAYLYKQTPGPTGRELTRFRGFNVDEPYQGGGEQLTHREVIIERITQTAQKPPHTLWLEPLVRPLTVRDIGARPADEEGLTFRIGMLDDPMKHRRVPYDISPMGAGAHIRIYGARGSGVSTTAEAIIASAALSYSPSQVQFYIIDAGSKLQEVAEFPNVGAYTPLSRAEMVDRIIGEFLRMIAVRQEQFQRLGATSFDTYLAMRATDATAAAEDTYGHMFLVIDGLQSFLDEDDAERTRLDRLLQLTERGASVGVHLMAAGAETTGGGYKLDPKFGLFIQHQVQDLTSSPVNYRDYEQRQAIKTIPSGQPGRVLDLEYSLHGRIMMPHTGTVHDSTPEQPYIRDWGREIKAFGAELSSRWQGQHAPTITTDPGASPTEETH